MKIQEFTFRFDWVARNGCGSALINETIALEFEFELDSDGTSMIQFTEALNEDNEEVRLEGPVFDAIEKLIDDQIEL